MSRPPATASRPQKSPYPAQYTPLLIWIPRLPCLTDNPTLLYSLKLLGCCVEYCLFDNLNLCLHWIQFNCDRSKNCGIVTTSCTAVYIRIEKGVPPHHGNGCSESHGTDADEIVSQIIHHIRTSTNRFSNCLKHCVLHRFTRKGHESLRRAAHGTLECRTCTFSTEDHLDLTRHSAVFISFSSGGSRLASVENR